MLENIYPREELATLLRMRGRRNIIKTVPSDSVEEMVLKGWTARKRGKQKTRIEKEKAHDILLEDRVWSLFYRMGFSHLSGEKGAKLVILPKDPESPRSQIDVVTLDGEVAIAVECKSAERPTKRDRFQEELGKFSLIKEAFSRGVKQFPSQRKRVLGLTMFLHNIQLSENDRKRADNHKIVLLDDQDLQYYETLVKHVGEAARYQFLADIMEGRSIPGLQLRLPAIRTKMGGHTCYTFSISPEYLLKIAYISHRAKGKASGVDAYQRMLEKSRLKKIKEYISEDGIFPSSIILNLDGGKCTFDRAKQECGGGAGGTWVAHNCAHL